MTVLGMDKLPMRVNAKDLADYLEQAISNGAFDCLGSAEWATIIDALLSTTHEAGVVDRNAVLEEAENAMLGVFENMNSAYLFTSGFDSRIIEARDAIRALKSPRGYG